MRTVIDLMPGSCRIALKGREDVRRWVAVYALTCAVLFAGYSILRAGHAERSARVESLAAEARLAWSRSEETQRLLKEIRELEGAITRYDRLAWPVRVSDVIAAVGEQVPESVSLTSLTLTPRQDLASLARAGSSGRTPGRAAVSTGQPPAARSVLAVEIEGLAPDDMTIARLVSGLDGNPLFDRISMDYARSRDVEGTAGRQFRVVCEVDLAGHYVFEAAPVAATPSEVRP
ncbi:MAG: PilN domain-containing protein [Phycisphaerales bacterium]|nr:PilN domain-containing protein [Phycisphaerales bacterium]